MIARNRKVQISFAGVPGGQDDFTSDFRDVIAEATRRGDSAGDTKIREEVLGSLSIDLARLSPHQLAKRLNSLGAWKVHQGIKIYKTPDEPCVAFCAIKYPSGKVHLYCLAACYRYPNGSDTDWWNQKVLPRIVTIPPC